MPSQSKCFFRYDILLSKCDDSSGVDHFDTYICGGAAPPSPTGDVGGCTMYAGKNCYGNGNNYEPCQGEHGGWSHAPDEYSYKVTSLWECTHICNSDSSCYAVVYLPSQSKCFLRYDILLSRCDYSTGADHFDTYICR